MTPRASTGGALEELVVCSLEGWDDVWRRNQFFIDALLRRNKALRVLLVEPPADPIFDLAARRPPTLPRLRNVTPDRRLRTLRPLKPLPRKLGPAADAVLRGQVLAAARFLGFRNPHLWLNDVTYAPLIARTGWPSVYDVTDDWLLAPFPDEQLTRLRTLDAIALRDADAVVVCSPALRESRGAVRHVHLIPNGVDVEHLRRPQRRPADLPAAPVAVYLGSLHESRLDVELVERLADEQPTLNVALVGPNGLASDSVRGLESRPNVSVLGSRPYSDVPGYLQHASVIIIPHLVTPFTDSLDPIKAYECLAVETPTVATPVAGFREHSRELRVVERQDFPTAVREAIASPRRAPQSAHPVTWEERAVQFELVLARPKTAGLGRRDPEPVGAALDGFGADGR